MILSKCFKCGGERVLISNSMQRPDYASHTEDECLIALNTRISNLEAIIVNLEKGDPNPEGNRTGLLNG
jgi:hypothetical protein